MKLRELCMECKNQSLTAKTIWMDGGAVTATKGNFGRADWRVVVVLQQGPAGLGKRIIPHEMVMLRCCPLMSISCPGRLLPCGSSPGYAYPVACGVCLFLIPHRLVACCYGLVCFVLWAARHYLAHNCVVPFVFSVSLVSLRCAQCCGWGWLPVSPGCWQPQQLNMMDERSVDP